MKPSFQHGNVRANCPDCSGAVTTFEYRSGPQGEFGTVALGLGAGQSRIYKLLRCAGCGRGGIAAVSLPQNTQYPAGKLEQFLPRTIDKLPLPTNVPTDLTQEFAEAELCASVEAWRAASALLRSTLEKTLIANGYTKGSLAAKIDEAATDGVITAARSRRAHEDIRVLGNDVLHDDWREVSEEEYEQAHHYAQRILEDFYDDRASVEATLTDKGRLAKP
jgi:hypothetical protein